MQKTALVTGSNRGIGFAVAKALLQLGYTTIITGRDQTRGETALAELSQWGTVYFHVLDVADPKSVITLAAYIEEKFGRLDVLVNNAGINYDRWHDAINADLDEVHETLETNLFGAWRMTQAVIHLMQKQQYGRIVNVSSGAGALTDMLAGTPGYSISKTALNALTIKIAREVVNENILVNAVCPGWVRTDMGGPNANRSPEKGAETIVWLATLPDGSPTGKFFRDKAVIPL